MDFQPTSLKDPRYDQSTYMGRLKHFLEITDLRNLFYSKEELEHAKNKVLSNETKFSEELWHYAKLYKSSFHPDTNELILAPFRMSSFVPTNFPVVLLMMLPNPSTSSIIFSQWLNQSVNVGFNYYNANKSTILTNEEIATAYSAAVLTSCGVALGLNQLYKSGRLPRFFNKIVPFIAVATAGTANLYLMRRKETINGITVYHKSKPIGKSKKAAEYAIGQTAFSRVIATIPSMILPPILMAKTQLTGIKYHAVHAGIIGICMGIGLPLAISLFDQTAKIKGSSLEPEFHQYNSVEFNRGL
eukprot:NODE_782_length_3919_cov_0.611518.p1 type:complete len:301 gc:universal NODE_782_length_3919_cov_0.611518:2831-3733(+)